MTDRVRLLGYPVALGMSVAEHVQDWVREFKLMGLGRDAGVTRHAVPLELTAMVDHLARTYASDLSEAERLREEAAARGDATVDLSYPVRPETAEVVRSWQRMLRAVDAYCEQEGLLTLARTAEQVALQDWVTEQFLRQLAGEPPTPWPHPVVRTARA